MAPSEDAEERGAHTPMRLGTKLLMALSLAALIAVGAAWLFVPPMYRAEAWVECISSYAPLPRTLVQPALDRDEHERFINSQAQLITRPDILHQVLKTPEVRLTEWFENADKANLLEELQQALDCAPVPNSNYIRVAMGCPRREDPGQIVEQVVLRYYGLVQSAAKDRYRDELAACKEDAERLDAQVRGKIEQITAFTADLPPGALSGEGSSTYRALLALTEQANALELQAAELKGLVQMYDDPAGHPVTPEDRDLVESDPLITKLKESQVSLELELAGLPDTPDSRERREAFARQLAAVQRKLDELRTGKLLEVQTRQRDQLRTALQNSQNHLFLTRETLMEAQAEQADQDRKFTELGMLQGDLTALRKTRGENLEFLRELERVVSAPRTVQINIARHAVDPDTPEYDVQVWVTVITLAVPALFGLGLTSRRAMARWRSE